MAAWVTFVTGSWNAGGQLQAAPWREQQSLEKRSWQLPWRAGLGRQEPWPGPSPSGRAAPVRYPAIGRQRDRNLEKWDCQRFQVLLSEPSLS